MTALLAGFIIPTLHMTKLRLEKRGRGLCKAWGWKLDSNPCLLPSNLEPHQDHVGTHNPLGGISRNQWAGTRAGSARMEVG